ncbi:MAG: hypothetical protein ABIJ96_00090 [Elusimicrobiota bacterium]
MKKNSTLFLILAASLLWTGTARAGITPTINYQGFLLDKSTLQPLDTPTDMKFLLCATESGDCSAPLFTETRCNLSVTKGRFDVEIGSTSGGITAAIFQNNDAVWLERQVDADGDCVGTFEALAPRMRVQAAGYAFQALRADTATITNDIATGTLAGTYDFTNTNSSFTAARFKTGIYHLTESGISRVQDLTQSTAKPLEIILPRSGSAVDGSSFTIIGGKGNDGGISNGTRGGDIRLLAGDGNNAAGGNVLIQSGNVDVDSPAASTSTVIIRGASTGINASGAEIQVRSGASQGAGNNIPGGHVVITGGGGSGTAPGGSVVLIPGFGAATGVVNVSSGTLFINGNAPVAFQVGASSMILTSAGRLGLGTAIPASLLHMSSGTLIVDGDPAAFSVGISTLVVTGGRVGVGTATPAAALDVAGGIGIYSRTQAQLEAMIPGRAGILYFCSNCSNSVNMVVSTNTVLSAFDSAGVGGTVWH